MTKDFLTEEQVSKMIQERHESTAYYTAVKMDDLDFKTNALPIVVEREKYRVVAPCKATIGYGILPHYDGRADVILQPGLLLTVGKIYIENTLTFKCKPENIESFIIEYLPESIRNDKHFSGHIDISIFRYHVWRDLEKVTKQEL